MEVDRGVAETPEADRERTLRLLETVAEPAARVWVPPRQLAFGRRDQRAAGYEAAVTAAERRGFPPVERSVGGRAVALDGRTTVAMVVASRAGAASIRDRYDWALEVLETACASLEVTVERGEPADSFCPGTCSLSTSEGKVAGVAQRVTADAAMVSAVVLVDGRSTLVSVLEPVYEALELPFERSTVSTLADAGGPAEPDPVVAAIESAVQSVAPPPGA